MAEYKFLNIKRFYKNLKIGWLCTQNTAAHTLETERNKLCQIPRIVWKVYFLQVCLNSFYAFTIISNGDDGNCKLTTFGLSLGL